MWVGFIEVNLIFLEVFFIKQELLINEKIRAREVQLIGANGEKFGVVSLEEALDKAYEAKLDLVLVSPGVQPPVCKLMNYGKYKFEQAKREKESRKNQKTFETKELRVTPNIDKHDFEFKAKNARKFLEDGSKVKITVRFRGRELNYTKAGEETLNEFIENLSDIANVEKKPLLEYLLKRQKNKICNILAKSYLYRKTKTIKEEKLCQS